MGHRSQTMSWERLAGLHTGPRTGTMSVALSGVLKAVGLGHCVDRRGDDSAVPQSERLHTGTNVNS